MGNVRGLTLDSHQRILGVMENPPDGIVDEVMQRILESSFPSPRELSDGEIADNYRLDHLYTNAFRDGTGKYFTVVSVDEAGVPTAVEAEQPGRTRNKVKLRLTFIHSEEGGYIKEIEFKRFKYYVKEGYVEQAECIT